MAKIAQGPSVSQAPTPPPSGGSSQSTLLGLGLDNEDGHKRITQGNGFLLLGGSDETHCRMTETTLKTMEELRRRNKHLHTVDPRELADIISQVTPR